jgi:hypothetical protein
VKTLRPLTIFMMLEILLAAKIETTRRIDFAFLKL